MASRTPAINLRIWRGNSEHGELVDFRVPVREGMVVLDAVLWVQANAAADLAVRWNCKAAKCGSCSAEINGFPRQTRRLMAGVRAAIYSVSSGVYFS